MTREGGREEGREGGTPMWEGCREGVCVKVRVGEGGGTEVNVEMNS